MKRDLGLFRSILMPKHLVFSITFVFLLFSGQISVFSQNPGSLDDTFTEVGNNNFNYNESTPGAGASSTGCLSWGTNGYNSANGGNIWYWSNGNNAFISNGQARMRRGQFISAGADLSALAGQTVTITFNYGAFNHTPLKFYLYSDYGQPNGSPGSSPSGNAVLQTSFTNSGTYTATIPAQYLTSGFGIAFQQGGSTTNAYQVSVDNLTISTTNGCPPVPEICNNGIDDDGDGLVDCADPDCSTNPCSSTSPTTIDLKAALVNGSSTDATSGVTVTHTAYAAGTANTNAGSQNCDGNSTFVTVSSANTDQNNLAAPANSLTTADILNNYTVQTWSFSQPIILDGQSFFAGDLDYDHQGFDEYHDAFALVIERNGVLTAATASSQGAQVTSGMITVGNNPNGGANLQSLGTLPVYYNSAPIAGGGTNNLNCGASQGKVTFDVGCDPIDKLHLVYFNAINTNENQGQMGMTFQDYRQNNPSQICLNADVGVTKSVSPTSVPQGQNVTFTLTATSVGNNMGVVICDPLPPCAKFVSASGDGTYDGSNWNVGDMTNGQVATMTVTVQALGQPGDCQNIASYTVDDSNLSNNVDSATFVITMGTLPDVCLEISKTATPKVAMPGDAVTIVTTLTNKGTQEGTNVVVKDLVPAGMNLDSFTPSVGTYNPSTGIWTIPSIVGGGTETLTLNLTVQ